MDGISYLPSSVLLAEIPKLTFKDQGAFGLVDRRGEAPRAYAAESGLGFYHYDTRYLGVWETTINGASPVPLAQELLGGGNALTLSMTNRDLPTIGGEEGRIRRDTFLVRRTLLLRRDVLYEFLTIRNFDPVPHRLQIEHWAGGTFSDIFEVRGIARKSRGRMLAPEERDDPVTGQSRRVSVLQYEGLDGRVRRTFIHRFFDSEKIRHAPSLVGYFSLLELEPKATLTLRTIISFDQLTDGNLEGRRVDSLREIEEIVASANSSKSEPFGPLSIETDNEILNRAIGAARLDLAMLLTEEAPNQHYPYAGIPWFSAPFGRDGIISAYQMLPWHPEIARGVLDRVLSTLGTKTDEFTDEQPGKVFHEYRRGEMAQTREVPFVPYYGSVDATPLALILLHEYVSWTQDLSKLREWWGPALRALEWIRKIGAPEDGLFLQYSRMSATGLVNQGWKDSHDSVMHADGRLAPAPIRLCEVQGYAYRARLGMSALARRLGQDTLAHALRDEALALRARFMERFWDNRRRYVYLALDGNDAPCKVLSSNMGHCLWSHILFREQAEAVARRLMSEAMFSGHGVRTLATSELSFNPMSYHNGSVWPHDNSLILEGLRNYGHVDLLERLAVGLLEVLELSEDFRLPELFCGFDKRAGEPPIPYEVACKPQAWGAGSVFLFLKSITGLAMEEDSPHLIIRSPILTSKIDQLEIRSLRGKDWEIDLTFTKTHGGTTVEIPRKVGSIKTLIVT